MATRELAGTPSPRTDPRRLFAVLGGLYLAQGIPTYLLIVALPPLLRESGASRTTIGLFSLLMLPLVLKFAWAPLIDRYPLVRRLGHRRGWIVPTQIAVALLIAAMAFLSPTQTGLLFVCALCITLLSSTQDIATDGFAVRGLTEETRAVGNAIQAGSVALGVIVGGTLSLVLFEHLGWRPALLTVSVLAMLPLLVAPLMVERADPPETRPAGQRTRPSLAAFFRRPGAWTVFLFALSYRASEGLVRGMEGTYLVDVGLPLSWIGYLQGSAAAGAGLLGAAAAALLIRRAGLAATLILLGTLRTLCFLAFSLSALHVLPGFEAAMTAAAFQTFVRYMELVAIYSLFMRASGTDQPGTDFTILTCAELVVYLVGTSIAGLVADRFGYPALFLSATVLSLLGIALAAAMLRRLSLSGPTGTDLSAKQSAAAQTG
ncbi:MULTISPECIES: RhtX/FptX family siderophore transporter [unclassified Aureimonas]|uniref:RhtX/FptX family siderophore transporter n=1 Tax=unclassified Aureimonas TaxID=2615206 RepID=UPI0007009285|nr:MULTISPECIES: RhtX/FptX family siderophore transporter [unclassified Aureimonas]KQT60719.1 RhtX rhizobactin transporter [Aureimonas sp. Leaf460]KQT68848.1 RhtX rhizobactin transporter [Aureimonas sp. Leaf427]